MEIFTLVSGNFQDSVSKPFLTVFSDDPHHSAGSRSSHDLVTDMFSRVETVIRPGFQELLTSERFKSDARGPVSCIIADSVLGFAIDVAAARGIPSISFRTISACCTWIYFCSPKLVENGDIPFKDEDMDRLVRSVPEMESFLRCRDLPSFYRAKEVNHPNLEFVKAANSYSIKATAHILNTFEVCMRRIEVAWHGSINSQTSLRCM